MASTSPTNARRYRAGDKLSAGSNQRHVFVLDIFVDCYWSKKRRYLLEDVELVVKLLRQISGTLRFAIYDNHIDDSQPIDELDAEITSKIVRVPWKVLEDNCADDDQRPFDGEGVAITQNEQSQLYFEVHIVETKRASGNRGTASGRADHQLLQVVDKLHVRLVDDGGEPIGGYTATVRLPDGSERKHQVGQDGMLLLEEIAGGSCSIDTGLPDKARVEVLTVDHANDPAQVVRVPNVFRAPLPWPGGAFVDFDDEDGSDPFTLAMEEEEEDDEERDSEPSASGSD